jgi:hypothetical protein
MASVGAKKNNHNFAFDAPTADSARRVSKAVGTKIYAIIADRARRISKTVTEAIGIKVRLR